MTDFIESFATQQTMPPYKADGARLTTVMFALATDAIRQYCDRFFNLGDPVERGVHYQPLESAQFGILTVTQYPSMASTNESGPLKHGVQSTVWDHVSQTELFVAVPIMRYRVTATNMLVDPEVRWFQPIVIIDNASSTFGAREILGVEALWGELTVKAGAAPGSFHLDSMIPSWRVFAPDSKQQLLPFLIVETGAATPVTPSGGSVPLASLTVPANEPALSQLLEAIPQLQAFLGGGADSGMRLVTLKQFRDAYDPTRAIYQALVESTARYRDLRDLVLYDRASVTLSFMWSDMVKEIVSTFLDLKPMSIPDLPGDLGAIISTPVNLAWSFLPPLVSVTGAMSFTADLEFGDVETVYTFPAD